MKKVTCVIPAHNESSRIGNVLKIVYNHPMINEVIVVDDGSKDNTAEVVRKFESVRLISLKKNRGKTAALLNGISKARGNILLLLDADLNGLNKQNVSELLAPILEEKADISMAIDYNSSKVMKIWIRLTGMENFSGLRAFKKNIMEDKRFKKIRGYGFETFLNKKIMEDKLKLKRIYWENVSNTLKTKKLGLIRGTWKDMIMIYHILKTVGLFNQIKQTILLKSFEVN